MINEYLKQTKIITINDIKSAISNQVAVNLKIANKKIKKLIENEIEITQADINEINDDTETDFLSENDVADYLKFLKEQQQSGTVDIVIDDDVDLEAVQELRADARFDAMVDLDSFIKIKLTQEAYISGSKSEPFFTADALDELGNDYTVTWELTQAIKDAGGLTEENGINNGNECDWGEYTVVDNNGEEVNAVIVK